MVAEQESASGAAAPGRGLLATALRRRLLFTILYFAEGAPIGFVWFALPLVLAQQGLEVDAWGDLAALLVLPWALKFLWAPLIDLCRGPRFGLRGWIACAQLVMVGTLLPLLRLETLGIEALRAWLLLHALAAATQDAAIDGLAIRHTTAGERGRLNGWMQAGALTGRGLFGGFAVYLGSAAGAPALVGALAATLAGLLLVHLFYAAAEPPREDRRLRLAAFRAALGAAAKRPRTWGALALAATVAASFETVGATLAFLLEARGAGERSAALFFAFGITAGLALGALTGGWLADRIGPRRAVLATALLSASAALAAGLAPAGMPTWAALSALYLAAGALTAASYALFMQATDPRLASTQFSAYMGATNLCEAGSAAWGGALAHGRGFAPAYAAGAAFTLLALPLLAFLGPRRRDPKEAGGLAS